MKLTIDKESYGEHELMDLFPALIDSDQQWKQDVGILLRDWLSDEPSLEVKTSGSTGTPKIISHSKLAMGASAEKTGQYFNLPKQSKVLSCLPYSFIAGKMMLIRAMVLGWDMIVQEPSLNPIQSLKAEIDFITLTPHQLSHILSKNRDKLKLVKKILLGGSPVTAALQKQIESLDNEIYIGYGMTETITHIAVKHFKGPNASSAYHALSGVHFEQDENDCLIIKADHLPEILHTTDMVNLLTERSFEWLGRLDNVINSGGIKLHPEEIEHKLSAFTDLPFFVHGVPDDVLGERLELFIESDNEQDAGKLKQKYSILNQKQKPKIIHICSSFLYTSTGKIRRNETVMQTLK